jgi:hypothetical protein
MQATYMDRVSCQIALPFMVCWTANIAGKTRLPNFCGTLLQLLPQQ